MFNFRDLQSTWNDRFLENFLIAILFILRVLLKISRDKVFFHISFCWVCLSWALNRFLTTNKATHCPLNYNTNSTDIFITKKRQNKSFPITFNHKSLSDRTAYTTPYPYFFIKVIENSFFNFLVPVIARCMKDNLNLEIKNLYSLWLYSVQIPLILFILSFTTSLFNLTSIRIIKEMLMKKTLSYLCELTVSTVPPSPNQPTKKKKRKIKKDNNNNNNNIKKRRSLHKTIRRQKL